MASTQSASQKVKFGSYIKKLIKKFAIRYFIKKPFLLNLILTLFCLNLFYFYLGDG